MQSTIPLPSAFAANGMRCGIKKRDGLDLGVLLADDAYPVEALFTTNSLLGAHIPVCRDHLERSGNVVRAVIVNSGNANCATGAAGIEDARRICEAAAERLGCLTSQVLCISTGVIGARLPVARILDAIPELLDGARTDGGNAFARAIMTTDTRPKHASVRQGSATTTGIAKGSGMIHPDLATMLAFVLSDAQAPLDPRHHAALVAERSFHRLTVDGDTSPNDTVLLWHSGRERVDDHGADLEVARSLCRQVAADGEGATRLVTIFVRGAADERQAAAVGRAIGTSMLTKTAITGRDPNWGRILSAAGRAAKFDPARARVRIGPSEVFADGEPHPEREAAAHAHLREQAEIELGVDLGLGGGGEAEVWSCDLTSDYVSINADYRS